MAKILIIKYGALGDIVMATSLIKQIQKHHANDNIYLLTSPAFVSLFDNWQGLSVISYPRKGLIAMLNTINWIRSNKFDCLYDLQSNDRTRLISIFSGIRDKVGNHPYFPYNIHPPDKYTGQKHIFDRMLELIASAGIVPDKSLPALPASQESKNKVSQWLQDHGLIKNNLVILHAGSSPEHENKRWPYYPDLAKRLCKAGYEIIWIGADADVDLNRTLSNQTGIDATSLFTINEIAELGRYAKFAITNDSGPMHILSCSGIPVYAFFGPTDWKRNHAIGQADNTFVADSKKLDQIGINYVLDRLTKDGLVSDCS